jgi:hypothetical protein
MKNTLFIYVLMNLIFLQFADSQNTLSKAYKKAFVSYSDFKDLVKVVEKHRSTRLLSLDDFLSKSKEEGTIVLDTRSDFRYARKHIKGAQHLAFTDFTQSNLAKLIKNKNTRILIYCNNNFEGDQVDFATKSVVPFASMENQILSNQKPTMLALNIPTYINLYGYGYQNVYELDELVNINDKRIQFEGSVVK